MKIRSITCFYNPRSSEASLDKVARLADAAYQAFTQAGQEVQTRRLSTPPFPIVYSHLKTDALVKEMQILERSAKDHDFAYLSVGPALPDHPESYAQILPILSATQDVFLSGLMTRTEAGGAAEILAPSAVSACAQIIQQAATLTPDGFTNLRFAALANVPPGGPFFPGSYHTSDSPRPAFALAMECADVALSLAQRATSLMEFRHSLVKTLETQAVQLTSLAGKLADQFDVDFRGIDFSLAPFPEDGCSLGKALESLGLPALGKSGSLAAAAFLASALDAGHWQRAGFNGLMMPVLEDSGLAARAAEGTLCVQDLLMYSAVCGTGIDTVPLPGNITAEQIYALLMDVAALALRLNKPLTARLMPIPGKVAGDPTQFNFSFFVNSRVMALDAAPLHGLLAEKQDFVIRSRAR